MEYNVAAGHLCVICGEQFTAQMTPEVFGAKPQI